MSTCTWLFFITRVFALNHACSATINNITQMTVTVRVFQGQLVGMSKNVSHYMTFAVLKANANKCISRNKIIPVGEPSLPTIRGNPLTTPEVVKYRHVKKDDAGLPSTRLEDKKSPSATDEHASHNAST